MTTERARHALPAVSRALFWLGLVGVTAGSLLPVALLLGEIRQRRDGHVGCERTAR
mgnify:CR=1 FL=1